MSFTPSVMTEQAFLTPDEALSQILSGQNSRAIIPTVQIQISLKTKELPLPPPSEQQPRPILVRKPIPHRQLSNFSDVKLPFISSTISKSRKNYERSCHAIESRMQNLSPAPTSNLVWSSIAINDHRYAARIRYSNQNKL